MLFAVAVVSGLCISFTTVAALRGQENGGDKKGANTQETGKDTKNSENAQALKDLELAARLIEFGRRKKSAASLLVAAQILHNTPAQKLKAGSKVDKEKPGTTAAAPPEVDNSPKALVKEAQKLSATAPTKALAAATLEMLEEKPRGAERGPQTDGFVIQPGQAINWNPINFVGGQLAVVHVSNGVVGSMSLEVRDQNGNLVARDNVPGTFFRVQFVPRWTGPFYIRLVNYDSIAFRCGMATN